MKKPVSMVPSGLDSGWRSSQVWSLALLQGSSDKTGYSASFIDNEHNQQETFEHNKIKWIVQAIKTQQDSNFTQTQIQQDILKTPTLHKPR